VAAHRVHGAPDFGRDLAQAEALPLQYFDFHIHLVGYQGCSAKSSHLLKLVYQFSIAALYQFTSAADTWGNSRETVTTVCFQFHT
jgi:hypothetical protein